MIKLVNVLDYGALVISIGRTFFVIMYDTDVSAKYSRIKSIVKLDPNVVSIQRTFKVPFVLPYEEKVICTNAIGAYTHVITFYPGCALEIDTEADLHYDGNIIGGDAFEVIDYKLIIKQSADEFGMVG